MNRMLPLIAAAVLVTLVYASGTAAQQQRPELVEGTSSVYKRVLTRPGDVLLAEPGGPPAGIELKPLYPVYVFKTAGEWLQVGRSVLRRPEGWIKAEGAPPWNTNIVGAFTSRGSRPRQLLFDVEEALDSALNDEAMRELVTTYRETAETVEGGGDSVLAGQAGIVSIERETFVDINEQFYLMPIVNFDEIRHPQTNSPMLKMELATLRLEEESEQEVVRSKHRGSICD